MAETTRNEKLNLHRYSAEEIARRMLETPPPPEKVKAKDRTRKDNHGDAEQDTD